jgi:hypothetical protein
MACEANQDTGLILDTGCKIIQDDTRTFTEVVEDIDTVPTIFSEEQVVGNLYTHYRIDIRYEMIESVLQMPVAEPGGFSFPERIPAEFVQVAAPYGRKVIAWTAERLGGWPELPAKANFSSNDVYIREDVTPATPEPMPGGTDLVFRVSGTYFYGLRRPRGPGDSLPTGIPAYYVGTDEENTVPEYAWTTGIITEDM